MKNIVPLILLSIVAFSFSAGTTTKVYFSQDTRLEMENDSIDLKKLQYYTDRRITLRRELSSGDVNVTAGTVKYENGRYINEIILKKYTPGICLEEGVNTLVISFEEGDSHSLSFGKDTRASKSVPYQIQADDWVKDYGKVFYDDNTYFITPGSSEAKLLIGKSDLEKTTVDKRYVKGRKVE